MSKVEGESRQYLAMTVSRTIAREVQDIAISVIVEGSLAYGGWNSNSDLDLEVIVHHFSDLMHLDYRQSILSIFKNDIERALLLIAKQSQVDILQVKQMVHSIDVGIRFILLDRFQRFCHLNLVDLSTSCYALSIRPLAKTSQAKIYTQRNFFGEEVTVDKYFWMESYSQLTLVPIALIDRDRYFPGSLVDRYLLVPLIIYDSKQVFSVNIKILKTNIARRMLLELRNYTSSDCGFDLMLSRYERVPAIVKAQLRMETINYLKQIEFEY